MSDESLQVQIEAAKAYEALFVPALFRQWTPILATAAHIQTGQRVLDVACGTGVLAREASTHVGPGGTVVGVDRSPGMIAVAKELAPQVEWREGVAESLPFSDQSFDAVVSQFGLMFFNDRQQAIREMFRVLASGRKFAVAVWDSLDSMPAYATVVELLESTAGTPAADALRAPFVLGDPQQLSALFAQAGVGQAQISTEQGVARFPSIRVFVEADLRGWLPMVGVVLNEEQIEFILSAAETEFSSYAAEDGSISFDLSAHIITSTKH
jgi:SAM-dependent methyltransferase